MNAAGTAALAGQRVLVTGGSRGLGRGIAAAMAEAGARVAVAARTRAQVEHSASEIPGASGHVFDVLDFDAIPALLSGIEDALGGVITTVVHAAGAQHRQPAVEFELSAFRRVIEVNLIAPFALSKEIGLRQLRDELAGQHIFIGSLTSFISMPNMAAYGASKSGVHGLVRSLSTEWAGSGIRVNGIAPGYFHTELTKSVFADEEWRRRHLARIPQGRFGEADDVAGVAVFLASAASAYITGQMIPVDGGWLAS